VRLFQNLIGNAVKFRRPGVAPVVTVGGEIDPVEGWHFRIADNGIGIERTEQDIFEIFRRLHPQRLYPGTGVGLAICKRIIHRHGGHIWYEPNAGGGSIFHFTISPHPAEPAGAGAKA